MTTYNMGELSPLARKNAIARLANRIAAEGIGDTDEAAIIRMCEINGTRFDAFGYRVE